MRYEIPFKAVIEKAAYSILLILASIVLPFQTKAQTWEKSFTNGLSFEGLAPAAGNDFAAISSLYQLHKFNENGQVLWSKNIGYGGVSQWSGYLSRFVNLENTPDGGYLAVYHFIPFGQSQETAFWLIKTNADGEVQWNRAFNPASEPGKLPSREGNLVADPNGGYWLSMALDRDTSFIVDYDMGLLHLDTQGNELGRFFYSMLPNDRAYGQQVRLLPDGNLTMAGLYVAPGGGNPQIMVLKTSQDGTVLWQQLIGECEEGTDYVLPPVKLAVLADGSLQVAGPSMTQGAVYMAHLSQDGALLSETQVTDEAGEINLTTLLPNPEGGFTLQATRNIPGGDGGDIWIRKYDAGNHPLWQRILGSPVIDAARHLLVLPDGGFIAAGTKGSWVINGGLVVSTGSAPYLARLDSLGRIFTQQIRGSVIRPSGDVCGATVGIPHVNWLVTAFSGNQEYYGLTDTAGNYAIDVPMGPYGVEVTPSSPYWQICEFIQTANVTEGDTVNVDFTAPPLYNCPYLQVDISTPFLRRCFQNTYTVNYCNLGAVSAQNSYVEVTLDDYLLFNTSDFPISNVDGHTYTFNLGTIAPGDCGQFHIQATVDCDSTLIGQTHCTTAHIYPDSLCLPTPGWSGASIELGASCTNDSVRFFIKNVGTAPTSELLPYRVIEDQVILLQGNTQLNPGQVEEVMFAANGATFRLESDQEPNHPGNSMPSITIEGCVPQDSIAHLGYATQYPEDDADPFVSIDCQENVGSWDPNDKRGFPKGYGEERWIEANTEIEYLIRFQNTGSDTAFNILVRDPLPPQLNLRSVRPGAASHPYTYQVTPEGVLEFHFDNIHLPDSLVDESGSHGFVKFRVAQQPENPVGAVIRNTAKIYFDFNPPVTTNETIHIVGHDFIEIDLQPAPGIPPGALVVSPNPVASSAVITINGMELNQATLEIFDMSGRLVRREIYHSNPFTFERKALPSGLYLCRLLSEGHLLAKGKILLP